MSQSKYIEIPLDVDIIAIHDGVIYEVKIAKNGKFCISSKSKYIELPDELWSELFDLRYLIIDFRTGEVYDYHPSWIRGFGYQEYSDTYRGVLAQHSPLYTSRCTYKVLFINKARKLPHEYEPDIIKAIK